MYTFNNKFTQNTLHKNVRIEVSAKDLAGEALSSKRWVAS